MRTYPEVGEAFGGYVVGRFIGRGGMGAVFEAEQVALHRSVALKVLSPELSDDEMFRRRFTDEAAVLAKLDSPHIVSLFDYGDHEGSLFIAMHLVNGRDLSGSLHDDGPMSMDASLEIVAQVAEALADAHASGLVHRDVKPSNVLVRRLHGEPFAYLCDFGIAKSEASPHTRTTGVMGSVGYMAPERHRGQDADARADIYSLGCLLWACISGRPPFEGTSDVQVALAHLQEPVPVIDPSTPATRMVDALVAKAMAKDPVDRFPTADEMRRELRRTQALLRQRFDGSPQEVEPPASEPTILRSSAGATAQPHTPVGGRRSTGRAVVAGLALLAAVGVGLAVVHAKSHHAAATLTSGVRVPAASTRSSSPTPRATSTGSRVAATPVACWDGEQAAHVGDCSQPSGVAGLAWVFPRFSQQSCRSVYPKVRDKTLVFECDSGPASNPTLVIRYSEWKADTDLRRYRYLDKENPGARIEPWTLDGEVSGTRWLSYESYREDPDEFQRYQWSATYAHHPFEISVEGHTRADRARGVAEVSARPARQLAHR